MRIALVTDSLSEHSGSRAAISLGERLLKMGVEVDIYATDILFSVGTKKRLDALGLKVYIVKCFLPVLFGKFLSKIPSGFWMALLMRIRRYDLVSFHGSADLILGLKVSFLPIVTTYYGTQYLGHPLRDKIIRLRTKLLIGFSDYVVAISRFTKKELEEDFFYHRSTLIYLGIESPVTEASNESRSRPPDKGVIRLFSLSRFVSYKGFSELILLTKSLIMDGLSFELTIAGTVIDRNYFEQMQKQAVGSPVKIIINPSDSDVTGFYQDCDVYVSCSQWEGFGLTFLEAARFGKPSVGFDKASIGEVIIDKKTGFLVDSLENFKLALRTLARDALLRERMGREAKRFSENFTWKSCSSGYLKVFSTAVCL